MKECKQYSMDINIIACQMYIESRTHTVLQRYSLYDIYYIISIHLCIWTVLLLLLLLLLLLEGVGEFFAFACLWSLSQVLKSSWSGAPGVAVGVSRLG